MYHRGTKTLAFAEGLRKSFVNPVQSGAPAKKEQPGSKSPKKTETKKDGGGGDDFFKAFGGGF